MDGTSNQTREGGAGDGNKLNYARLVPMLGLAVYRCYWDRECQKEIQKTKATLELELEKEREKLKDYQEEVNSVIQYRKDEWEQLQQEHKTVEEEKQMLVKFGARDVLQQALQQENDWYREASATLKELEGQLVDRQNIYCSPVTLRSHRLEMEKDMLLKAKGVGLGLESDLKDIFKRDTHCAGYLNVDKRKNGSLMWVYLKYWQLQVTEQKHKKAEEVVSGGKIQYRSK